MRVQQAGFVNRDMTTQVAHKRQCSEQRALRGVTKGLQVKSYAGDGMGPGSDEIHYFTFGPCSDALEVAAHRRASAKFFEGVAECSNPPH